MAQREANPLVYFDITIGGALAGRITMELRRDVVPKAAENFRSLCTGARASGLRSSPISQLHVVAYDRPTAALRR